MLPRLFYGKLRKSPENTFKSDCVKTLRIPSRAGQDKYLTVSAATDAGWQKRGGNPRTLANRIFGTVQGKKAPKLLGQS